MKEWQTEGASAYSPFNFYTASQDARGHGVVYHVKFPEYMVPELQWLKENFPEHYRTIHDIVRDGARHRIAFLKDNFDHFVTKKESSIYMSIEQADNLQRRLKAWRSLPGKIKAVCSELKECEDYPTLSAYITEQMKAAQNYKEPWKSKCIKVLEMFHGEWMEEYQIPDEMPPISEIA